MHYESKLTPRSKRILDIAYGIVKKSGADYIGSEHILLGILSEPDSLGYKALDNMGVNLRNTMEYVINSDTYIECDPGEAFRVVYNSQIFEGASWKYDENGLTIHYVYDDLHSADIHFDTNTLESLPDGVIKFYKLSISPIKHHINYATTVCSQQDVVDSLPHRKYIIVSDDFAHAIPDGGKILAVLTKML